MDGDIVIMVGTTYYVDYKYSSGNVLYASWGLYFEKPEKYIRRSIKLGAYF